MASQLFIQGKPLQYDPNRTLGKGGEGEVFDLGVQKGEEIALKLLKGPDHPDYAGNDAQQVRDREGAKLRLDLIQRKLRAYPKVSDRVIAPLDVVTDAKGNIVGFTMKKVSGATVLRQLTKPGFCTQAGIDNNAKVKVFTDLHRTVASLHPTVQIGDFNYLGVMVKQQIALLIDADSIQFAGFPCRSFTPRFVDPLVCSKDELVLRGNHSDNTDWYAFALMLFESLLYVAPYGGVLTGNTAKLVKQDLRPLKRISVFHPDVRYPDKGIPMKSLNDDLLQFYHQLLEKDVRTPFPLRLLESMRWVECTTCGAVHCRTKCPVCAAVVAGATISQPSEERHGKVTVGRLLQTPGVIVDAVFVDGKLRLLYHEDGVFYREGRQKVTEGDLEVGLVAKIAGDETVFATGSTLVALSPGRKPTSLPIDTYRGQSPTMDSNGSNYFWSAAGRIQKSDAQAPKFLGTTLTEQTLMWSGPKFGFGTYRVGNIRRAFIFDLDRQSVNDSVELPAFTGDPIEADCYFSSNRCWFFTVHNERGKIVNRCSVIDRNGKVVATAEAQDGDDHWLANGHGRCAATLPSGGGHLHCLFVGTDDGLVRVDENNGALVQKVSFPDTKGLVRSDDRLVLSNKGITLVGTHEARLLTIS